MSNENLENQLASLGTTETPVCTIDSDTRVITVPTDYRTLGVEADEKVTRIPFKCPKVVGDNIDLSQLNLYVNYKNANNELNTYLITDVTVSGDYITFSWLLSRHVTKYKGTVNYIVCAKKTENSDVVNEWNTRIASGIVNEGLEATETIEAQNVDVIEQILERLERLDDVVDDIDTIPDYVAGEGVKIENDASLNVSTVSLNLNTIAAAESGYVLNNNNDFFPLFNLLTGRHRRISFINFVSNLWSNLMNSYKYAATYSKRGLVKPDGRTVFVDAQGTLSVDALAPFEIDIITGDTESAVKFSLLGDSSIRLDQSANGFISTTATPNTYFDRACVMKFDDGKELYVTPNSDSPFLADVKWKTGGTQPTGEILCNMRLNNDEKLELYNFNNGASPLVSNFFVIASITPVTVEEVDE